MTLQKLAGLIAKREGKRSQAKIHDIKESLSILFDLMAEEFENDCFELGEIHELISETIEKRARKIMNKKSKAKKK